MDVDKVTNQMVDILEQVLALPLEDVQDRVAQAHKFGPLVQPKEYLQNKKGLEVLEKLVTLLTPVQEYAKKMAAEQASECDCPVCRLKRELTSGSFKVADVKVINFPGGGSSGCRND
ncbi:MAG: hypothetical protein FH749_06860 [Firmicutes bacterium]|nr:hypothetical protein [Bacillota bacterium]